MPVTNSNNNYVGAAAPVTISGNYYNGPFWFGGSGGSTTTRSTATGNLYFVPFFVYRRTTFTKIGVVATAIAGNVNMGIYRDTGTNSRPTGSVISGTQSGSISTAAGGFISFTFGAAVTLSAGMYWLAYSTSTTISLAAPTGGGYESGPGRGLGYPAAPVASPTDSTLQGGWRQAFTYSATLPAVGTLVAFNALAVGDIFVWLQAQ